MAKPATQSSDYKYTVTQQALIHNGKPTGFFGNFREDNGVCLGVTSEKYGLVQNEALLDAATSALAMQGLTDYEQNIIVTGGGERVFAEFTFRNKQLASEVGDLFGYRLTFRNSFDRSLRIGLVLGFLRLICKNGAATTEREFGFVQKHSKNVTAEFIVKAIQKALCSGEKALKVFDAMAKTAITDEQGQNILKHLEAGGILSGVLRQNIEILWLSPRRVEDQGRNLYNLYNAVTEYLTHNVRTARYEYADKVNSHVLLKLVNAARKPEQLGRLILPVPAEGVTITVDGAPIAEAAGADIVVPEIVG